MRKLQRARRAPSSVPAREHAVPHAVEDTLRSPGRQLSPANRAFMEPRFGHDFSRVRVHTDARAAESARAVHAVAYTVGRHIVFGSGEPSAGTLAGQRLLAHELAHVVQQRSADAPATPPPSSAPDERGADAMAHDVVSRGRLGSTPHASAPALARQESEGEPEPRAGDGPTYNATRAEPEVEQPPNGVFFNGVSLIIRRGGDVKVQASAFSGTSGMEDWQKSRGPIPDGKQYFMMPQVTKPPVTDYQPGGVVGARGIDSGYQQILDKTAQGAWGEERIAIEPSSVCVPLPDPVPEGVKPDCGFSDGRKGLFRSGFYLHGGDPGRSTTSGCIKVADKAVFKELRENFQGRVPLWVVKYRGKA